MIGIVLAVYRVRVWRILEREKKLQVRVDEAIANIKVLHGLIPICAKCKKIRDDRGFWNDLAKYIHCSNTLPRFSVMASALSAWKSSTARS